MKVYAYQHGLYPRSEQVVAATRGLDRGRTEPIAVERAFDEDLARWIEVQRQADLDFFSDGLLRWQDIFRPLVEGLGQKPHTLIRWFDTNTFFRQPVFGETLAPLGDANGAFIQRSVPTPGVATLPSPYMFSRAAETRVDRNRLMREIAGQLLNPLARAAADHGIDLIHLEEPWLAYEGIGRNDWPALNEALTLLKKDVKSTIVFHLYFGDAAPHLPQLRTLPVDVIGVDLVETDVAALGTDWKQGLLAGVVDGRSSIVEPADRLVEVARHLAETVRPRNLYLSSNSELAFLPTGVAERKVQRLGEAAKRIKQLVSV